MARIKPFQAYRPKLGLESQIAALPYDVYNRQEAKEIVRDNPMSFLNIDRAETQFDDSVSTYDERVYERAKSLLWSMINNGDFVQEDKKVFYIYELTMNGRKQTGIVGCASVDDYLNQVIKKHENTREEKELDRIRHVDICNAQTGPIFLAYRSNEKIRNLILKMKKQEALYQFTSSDQITHTIWVIDQEDDIALVEKTFELIDNVYIADGHHRCASAVKVGLKRRELHPDYLGDEEFNYFLSVLFAEDELLIMDYNRVIKDTNGLSEDELLEKILEVCTLAKVDERCCKPRKKGELAMRLSNNWYMLQFKDNYQIDDPVEGLDVSILQNHILEPVFGIADPKTDKRIDFVGGIRGMEELEKRVATDAKVAFALYPTSIQELFAVADEGLLMPPKSTWFEPKLRSGLFIHVL